MSVGRDLAVVGVANLLTGSFHDPPRLTNRQLLSENRHRLGPMTHLRFAGLPSERQRAALETLVRAEPFLMDVLVRLRTLGLPDAWVTSGAIYNCVWNRLTDRPPLTGIKDVDLIYFDDTDLGYDAEDKVIARATTVFSDLPVPVELRNQARVHLWFPERFGIAYPRLTHATQSLDFYASKTHAVALRLEADDGLTIAAPFGLEAMFAFRMVPNRALDNRLTHEKKCARARVIWTELEIEPW